MGKPTPGNIGAGDAVWRGTYDPVEKGHMNTPESLKAALEQFGFRSRRIDSRAAV